MSRRQEGEADREGRLEPGPRRQWALSFGVETICAVWYEKTPLVAIVSLQEQVVAGERKEFSNAGE